MIVSASKGFMEGGKIRRRPSSDPPARPPHLSASAVLKIALPNPLHAGILFLNTSRETVLLARERRGH